MINNDIVDNFQSAYKAGHSCETALLRVYNDIVTTIGRGNGAMLVLRDLLAAFDTIDHYNIFCILGQGSGTGRQQQQPNQEEMHNPHPVKIRIL